MYGWTGVLRMDFSFLWRITFPTVVKRVPTCVRNINNDDVTLQLCIVV